MGNGPDRRGVDATRDDNPGRLVWGVGVTQGRVEVGFTGFESMSKTMDGVIFRLGGDIFVVPNFAIGMSYSYSQFRGAIGGDPVKTQINTFRLSATYYIPPFGP